MVIPITNVLFTIIFGIFAAISFAFILFYKSITIVGKIVLYIIAFISIVIAATMLTIGVI